MDRKKNGISVNNEIVYVAIVYIIYICTKFIYIKIIMNYIRKQ